MAEENSKRELDITEKLSEIQTRMDVPKDKHNDFGGYDYRSAESILNEFKKYSREYNVSLTLKDEIVEIAGRVYVKSTATFIDCENGGEISGSGVCTGAGDETEDGRITGYGIRIKLRQKVRHERIISSG